ncbi:peptidoglycan editing factor PgeF [Aerococcaceae bacterium zg-ZUI334]|uniref:peptidoglycan editing factor PgeF n=2 Tax=Lactobacillales TaxID=186826 RepID=UPI0013B9628E|nr:MULTISPECIES: peptidoglycan editing factor PgeF [unclassified Facklamia]MBR7927618.1 peptidoglycan editing factor PgeF [Aerococcaceae bacterium zg-ZUI334]NEW64628.1 peptidoglycan editing factor PgeF [Facklamia sp. 252]NEW67953.1 peptidoglycan editing factor PgeF [Facklamia sp. 253]
MISQPSEKLTQHHLPHAIGGMSYNFKLGQGDSSYQQAVERLLQEMGIRPTQLYHANQVHGHHVAIVSNQMNNHATTFASYPMIEACDGLITNESGVALLIRHADCTPIVLYDPVNHVLAAVHSGWRSTAQRISIEALKLMQQHFQTEVRDVVAYVGPSIDAQHYEVGAEVYEAFELIGNREQYFMAKGEKYHLDMVQANVALLKLAGLKDEQIEYSTESTYTSERLHSARHEGINYHLNALCVQLP